MPVFAGRCPMPHELGDYGPSIPRGTVIQMEGCPVCGGSGRLSLDIEEATSGSRAFGGDMFIGYDAAGINSDWTSVVVMQRSGLGESHLIGEGRLQRQHVSVNDEVTRQSYRENHEIRGPLVHTRFYAHAEMQTRGEVQTFESMGLVVENRPMEAHMRITIDIGRVIELHVEREGLAERVRILRELGEYLRRWSPEAADALSAYDGKAR